MTASEPLTGTPRWVEPEGTPEQIADACVAHLAAGGRVDSWQGDHQWRQTLSDDREDFAERVRMRSRFALVYSDPPQPERPCPACRVGDIYGDEQNHTCGRPEPVMDALPSRRVPAPEGVTVIGWTEPTDDEPRCALVSRVAAQDAELTRLRGLVGRLADIAGQAEWCSHASSSRRCSACRLWRSLVVAEARAEVPR
jgi:hypothetical protein